MWKYLFRRLGASVALLLVVATILFFSIHLLPGDPVLLILGGDAAQPTPEQIAMVRAKLGLDKPLWLQYLSWLQRVSQGDLGRSLVDDRPVARDLANRLPRTLQLVIPATLLSTAVGVSLGMFAARRRGRLADPIASSTALMGFSMPVFVVGMLLVALFSITLGWLPPTGYVPFGEDPAGFLRHLILPALALSAAPTAITMRMTRSSFLEQSALDYVRTARAKGLPEPAVAWRHVLRNALLPVVTVVGLQIGGMFAGAVLVEYIFSWPGLNTLLLNSISTRDYPIIQGVVLLAAVLFVFVNLATDLCYALVNPRIRYE
ncbi:MAG: binding-protein-dependent transport system inner rane component [candidate division NC10 bacterium]|nr:binding-protein-dependent transport system inner rane component [candidate division NC10 bacterium]